MSNISFNFNLEKLVHGLAMFSVEGVPDLTKLKAAKLMYFADKEHLLRYGRPVLGDVYFCLPYGPIPSISLNEMNDAIAAPEVEDEDRTLFNEVLEVRAGAQPTFAAKNGFDSEVFSESEIEVLRETANRFGKLTAGQLVSLTHKELTWTIPNEHRTPEGRSPIPYELFFVGASADAQEILKTLLSEQEEKREFDAALSARR
jgi:uncharacterized phage-associated protein